MNRALRSTANILILPALVMGCGGGDDDNALSPGSGDLVVPQTYTFESRFTEGQSSVNYTGQTFRHLLISDLTTYIESLQDGQDLFGPISTPAEVLARLNFYYRFDTVGESANYLLETNPPATPGPTYGMVSEAKSLSEKIAGNDVPLRRGMLKGWTEGLTTSATPEDLIDYWFRLIANNATDGNPATDPTVTPAGQNLQELVQKFLGGAVAYSQAAEDYLSSERGLQAQNTKPDEGSEPFTTLEHNWDEGFGWYGAARNFNNLTDTQIAENVANDTNGDGVIDLYSEYNWGHSQNSADRDLGASPAAPTNFTKGAFDAFLTGRAIIAKADGPLTQQEFSALEAQRDLALENWEKSIAATVVHYINESLQAMNDPAYNINAGTTGNLEDLAEVWSELKGFALSLQFNPQALLSDADFDRVHALIGDAPVLANGTQSGTNYVAAGCVCNVPQQRVDAYRDALLQARKIIVDAYAFDPANIGDANGENGW